MRSEAFRSLWRKYLRAGFTDWPAIRTQFTVSTGISQELKFALAVADLHKKGVEYSGYRFKSEPARRWFWFCWKKRQLAEKQRGCSFSKIAASKQRVLLLLWFHMAFLVMSDGLLKRSAYRWFQVILLPKLMDWHVFYEKHFTIFGKAYSWRWSLSLWFSCGC